MRAHVCDICLKLISKEDESSLQGFASYEHITTEHEPGRKVIFWLEAKAERITWDPKKDRSAGEHIAGVIGVANDPKRPPFDAKREDADLCQSCQWSMASHFVQFNADAFRTARDRPTGPSYPRA